MCCGKYIPEDEVSSWNYAHVISGNGRSKEDGMIKFIFICNELHIHQGNCKAHTDKICVKYFRKKYWHTEKHRFYYDKLIDEKGIKFE